MEVVYKKQPTKYLKRTDKNTRKKLEDAIDGLKKLNGDIIQMQGSELYRLKIYHYRIFFAYNTDDDIITIEEINPRGDAYK